MVGGFYNEREYSGADWLVLVVCSKVLTLWDLLPFFFFLFFSSLTIHNKLLTKSIKEILPTRKKSTSSSVGIIDQIPPQKICCHRHLCHGCFSLWLSLLLFCRCHDYHHDHLHHHRQKVKWTLDQGKLWQTQNILTIFRQIWINLYLFVPIWTHLEPCEPFLSYMKLIGICLTVPVFCPIFPTFPTFFSFLLFFKKIFKKEYFDETNLMNKKVFCVKIFCCKTISGEKNCWWFFFLCSKTFFWLLFFKIL